MASDFFKTLLGGEEESPETPTNRKPESDDREPPEDEEEAVQQDSDEKSEESEEPTVDDGEGDLYELPDGSQVSLSELAAGYERHKNYTQKTQRLAEQVRELEQRDAQTTAMAQQYAQVIEQAQQFFAQNAPPAPDASLIESDPVEFLRQKEAYAAHNAKMQQLDYDRSRIVAMSFCEPRSW